jgi:hypothetical protein
MHRVLSIHCHDNDPLVGFSSLPEGGFVMGVEKEKVLAQRDRRGSKKAASMWLGFLDIPLSEDDKARIPGMNFEGERAFDFIAEMVEDGYKITISQDKAHSCYISTATGQHTQTGNDSYSLTGRGPDAAGSLAALAYKHIILCERGEWANLAHSPADATYG